MPNPAQSDQESNALKSQPLRTTAAAFLRLGCMSFGGPVAHLGYLRHEFVTKRRWLSDERYAGLMALCQFLPGPASSQIAFAIGALRGGVLTGLVASVCFLLPSALIMVAVGIFLLNAGGISSEGKWLIDALKLVAVPFVAQAIVGMGRSLCPDLHRLSLAALAAAINILFPSTTVQILTILCAGFWGLLWSQWGLSMNCGESTGQPISRRLGALLLSIFTILLLLSLALPRSANLWHTTFTTFYSSGSLVFGGGHVVLPLLRDQLVPYQIISDDLFLGGYGAAQAVPGPLFSFAGYLGVVIFDAHAPLLGATWCLLAIFLPAWLIIGGALPFWDYLSMSSRARSIIAGANSAVVGILFAAFYSPVCLESLKTVSDAGLALFAFVALERWRVAPIGVVALVIAVSWLVS